MLDAVQAWLDGNGTLLWILVAFSAVMFVASLVGMPWVVAALPQDYFARQERWVPAWGRHHPVLRWTVRVCKNLAGCVLLLAGVAMLALPGQGLLTIAVALMLLEFPGKRRLVRWLGRQRRVRRGLDWLRGKMGKPPFGFGPTERGAFAG